MKKSLARAITGLCGGALVVAGAAAVGTVPADAARTAAEATSAVAPYKVLVVGKTLGFRHSHIDDTTNAVIKLGQEHGFTVDVWDPPVPGRSPGQPDLTMATTPFTSAEALSQYATILFASPVDGTNNQDPAAPRLLNDSELAALQGYIHHGGGYVGLHAATDTMHAVPWYSKLSGGSARFRNHPAQQQATMVVESPNHPSTTMLPKKWSRFDEWYNFTSNPRQDVHVLLTLDESTYTGGSMGADHPISWCQNFEGGRSWYEGAGHVDSSYTDPLFLAHLLGGIEWTAGVVEGGGNCVTFPEVKAITVGLDDGSQRTANLGADIARYLADAEAAADAGDHAQAAHILQQAQGKSHGLQDATLTSKIGDLVEWQTGLIGF
jgi:type 1 glutamine amidotransferase